MCLSVVYRGKKKREALAELPERFYVWKAIRFRCGRYYPPVFCATRHFIAGRQRADTSKQPWADRSLGGRTRRYQSGWHASINRAGAYAFRKNYSWIKCDGFFRCEAHKKDITAIGEQDGQLVLVFSHLTFPKKCGN